jgi:hypothetical protein
VTRDGNSGNLLRRASSEPAALDPVIGAITSLAAVSITGRIHSPDLTHNVRLSANGNGAVLDVLDGTAQEFES